MVINGFIECGKGWETQAAIDRADYYAELLNYFGLLLEDGLGCADMGNFTDQSASAYAQNFMKGDERGTCKISTEGTEFSMFRNDDYKRCVLASWDPDYDDSTPPDDGASMLVASAVALVASLLF